MNEREPLPVPADIAAALAARAARLAGFARQIVYCETTSSTNDVADRLASAGAAHGTVATAEAQESGRGRMGRNWFSPPGAGLYVSVVLRPEDLGGPGEAGSAAGVALASAVSLTAGVALCEAILASTGLPAAIKWPNDLVVERRKLCGILAEAAATTVGLRHVILGYGINIRPAAYPPDIAHRATSLESELGRAVDRAEVLAETLASLSEWLGRVQRGGFDAMLRRWRELSPSSVGARVEVMEPGGAWAAGTTAGLDPDGALLVSLGGATRRVIAGEVRWL